MNQIEFYEALARIAEEASLPPHAGLFPDDKVWLIAEKQKLPLGYKLESLLLRIYDNICD